MLDDYDPRVTAARPDLAASYLEGKVEAARFVDGTVREVRDAQTPVRGQPSPDAALTTEALRGDQVTVYEETEEGWCWLRSPRPASVARATATCRRPHSAPA